jgi:hypothetical protein
MLLWNVDSVVCVCLVLLNPKNHGVFKIKMMILIYFYVWNDGSTRYPCETHRFRYGYQFLHVVMSMNIKFYP